MGDLTRVIDDIVRLLIRLGGAMLDATQSVEEPLREHMSATGIPATFQTIILLVAAIVMILLAVRIFGGLLRFAVIVVLGLLAIKVLMPNLLLPSQ